MERERIIPLIESIRDSISRYEEILMDYSRDRGIHILGHLQPLIPPEITSAFGIESVKLPETVVSGIKRINTAGEVYRAVVLPEGNLPCLMADLNSICIYRINYPGGYGEDTAVALHNETAAMLQTLCNVSLRDIEITTLKDRCEKYDILRRRVRSITAMIQESAGMITAEELNMIFEVSSAFPPDISLPLITPVSDLLKELQPLPAAKEIKALIYGGREIPAEIITFIESRGITVVEDDFCRGRRLFDISINSSSEYVFYELLDAYSYRPMSPCTRNAEERYELIYKLLRNYGINLVILFNDGRCEIASGHINYLRIRCMRDGIDPLVIDSRNYMDKIEDYQGRA